VNRRLNLEIFVCKSTKLTRNMSSWKTCRSTCSWVVQCRTPSSWQYRKNYA